MITRPRMQNVLLAISACLLGCLFWAEMCYGIDPSSEARTSLKFIEHTPFMILTIVTTVLSVTAIFYRKQYIMQVRVCIINMLILLGYQIWILVYFLKFKEVFTFTFFSLVPLLCILLHFLAMRYSWRDATLVIAHDLQDKVKKNKKN